MFQMAAAAVSGRATSLRVNRCSIKASVTLLFSALVPSSPSSLPSSFG
ncbi:hypothetical protein SLEP1_g9237 [Rubroshorea leprosula]|uniref:Uncharacterized protein n=1 Tax=Rubroshorea leprosula TaxID=152421 RepID=A0AAV5I9Z2_9ROSI|nr:hypothetical protein SLEP1_g9237 [Rubroshorea leprosula]